MTVDLNQPLSDEELDVLSDFLFSDRVPDTTLSLEGLDGLFCALIIGPDEVSPAEWLPALWGDAEFQGWKELEDGEKCMALMLRHWRSIATDFQSYNEEEEEGYWPLVYLPEDEVPDSATDTDYAHEWALGFREGMEFNADFWARVLEDEELSNGLLPIVLLEQGHEPDHPEEPIDFGLRQELLGAIIPALHAYWAFARNSVTPKPMLN